MSRTVAPIFLIVTICTFGSVSTWANDEFEAPPAPAMAPSVIVGTKWFPIGPAPVDKCQAPAGGNLGINAGGRSTVLAVNPAEPDDVWMGTATGGVWHSVQAGVNGTWNPVSDHEESLAIGALALDACDASGCDVVYAGTGENAIRRDTYYGAGLLVGTVNTPTDVTWSLKGQSLFNLASINNVVLDPSTTAPSKRLYVTLSSGVTASGSHSTWTAPVPPQGYGLYQSEDDGDSWTKLAVPGSDGAVATDLEMHPQNSNLLFAGFMGKGIFRGDRDPGTGSFTWCPLHTGIPVPGGCPDPAGNGLPDPADLARPIDHVEVTIHEDDSTLMYAVFGHCPSARLDKCQPSVFRSQDGGATWNQRWQGTTSASGGSGCPRGYSRYTHGLTIDPTDAGIVYISAMRLCLFNADFPGWAGIGDENLHYDAHQMVFPDPNDPQRIYVTTDGGFSYSNNGGTSWLGGNVGLQTLAFQSISTSPIDGVDEIVGGTQDNGPLMWTGVKEWERLEDGDSGSTVMDLNDKKHIFDTYHDELLRRSNNFGSSWAWNLHSGIPDEPPAAFYAPLAQDPTPPRPLYFGTNRLYHSDDQMTNWDVVSPVLGGDGVYFSDIEDTNVITAIAVAPSNPQRIWVGYYDGQIWRTTDVGNAPCNDMQCWQNVTVAGLPDAPVTSLAVHPTLHEVAYATFSGFQTPARLYRTTNDGANWTARSGPNPGDPDSLPDLPANVIRLEPSAPTRLWVGTDRGVYKSVDEGVTWVEFGNGLPNAPVYDLSIDESRGRLVAGTHGRGAYLLTSPWISGYLTWDNGDMEDIPIYGYGFESSITCTLSLVLQDGATCASGSLDALGRIVTTDDEGKLSTLDSVSNVQPLAWACFDGNCVGGVSLSVCTASPTNPLTTVSVDCAREIAASSLAGYPVEANPPSTVLTVSGHDGAPLPSATFDLVPAMHTGDGTTSPLCTLSVPIQATGGNPDVLLRAHDEINSSLDCIASGVSATLQMLGPDDQDRLEDAPGDATRLSLESPTLTGGLLVTSLHAGPGEANGVCFDVNRLTQPLQDSATLMRMRFETASGGAAGGGLRITEGSLLGTCTAEVSTQAGDTGSDIAGRVVSAFAASSLLACTPDANPHDLQQDGDSVTTVLPSRLVVCLDDPGVGFSLIPEGIGNRHPVSDPGGSGSFECTGPAGATITLDGSGSSDPDSTPGTNDDIATYEWFEDFGLPSELPLGTAPVLLTPFSLGDHTVTLRVTDQLGLQSLRTATKTIVDTVPPSVTASVNPTSLWPPNHRMVGIGGSFGASDLCGATSVVLHTVVSDEPDNAPGDQDGNTDSDVQAADLGTPDGFLLLRAERDSSGLGRSYSVTYRGSDSSGNTADEVLSVDVPILRDGTDEPLTILLDKSAPGTVATWTPVPGSGPVSYNVIRGNLAEITETATTIGLGSVICIEAGSLDETTVGDEDLADPLPGQPFFYLVEYADPSPSGYGTVSAPKPREPVGGCGP